jgi:hypothetical protein
MKAFLASVAVAVAIGVSAYFVLLGNFQVPSYAAFTTEGARVGNPGSNLVGF